MQKVVNSNQVIIKTRDLNITEREELAQKLSDSFSIDSSKITAESISATVGNEMRRSAVLAVAIAVVLMLLYIFIRFKDMIRKAYETASEAHKDQKRKSGEPYIIHPLCVALILADLELDKETIIAGLLHDVVEDTGMTIEEIRKRFGDEVALLVDGVTKLGQIDYSVDKVEVQAENLRKMFLAMGLPDEGIPEVTHTLGEIGKLRPDSLTVHSLAVKRASRLNVEKEEYADLTFRNSEEIMEMTRQSAVSMGLNPYYLYRQKNMKGNLENTGYASEGKEGLYNMLIMEETESILAAGAGASTKFVQADGRITRVVNPKDVRTYISRIDELIGKKRTGA